MPDSTSVLEWIREAVGCVNRHIFYEAKGNRADYSISRGIFHTSRFYVYANGQSIGCFRTLKRAKAYVARLENVTGRFFGYESDYKRAM